MRVYADNAATTQISERALQAMMPAFREHYGNPSSLHTLGQNQNELLQDARARVAKCLGCEPREIYFTSGGSEADNQAIRSAALYGAKKGKKHIISTPFEDHAVLHTLDMLQKEGFEVSYLDVKEGHNITAQQVKDAQAPWNSSLLQGNLSHTGNTLTFQAPDSTALYKGSFLWNGVPHHTIL